MSLLAHARAVIHPPFALQTQSYHVQQQLPNFPTPTTPYYCQWGFSPPPVDHGSAAR